MIQFIYTTLAAAGFTHPLHPVMTHIPMGMVIGAFLFQAASFRWEVLAKTAHHCIALACIFIPPTVLFGYMDWQYKYTGYLSSIIMAKIILATVLFILLLTDLYLFRKGTTGKKTATVLYTLNLFTAVGLGFLGGKLIFG
ncbi:MAG TPA: hypothetical protein PKG60_04040 [Spirochaetota bacterium]|nr:hypothetical protein [Spirochaetota bacterium]HPS85669.1 hypothetical protein [Spirochaetota bacterium]